MIILVLKIITVFIRTKHSYLTSSPRMQAASPRRERKRNCRIKLWPNAQASSQNSSQLASAASPYCRLWFTRYESKDKFCGFVKPAQEEREVEAVS
jgi:hypothetical protein